MRQRTSRRLCFVVAFIRNSIEDELQMHIRFVAHQTTSNAN